MNISVDGGGLCYGNNRYGNAIFSINFIQSLRRFDKKNIYSIYSFCSQPDNYKASPNIKFKNLQPKKFWMTARVSLEEIIKKQDIFLALNQAVPFYTPAKIISFSHGLSFYFFPEYYSVNYSYLYSQLKTYIRRSRFIAVSSSRVKDELCNIESSVENKIIVLPFGVPYDMCTKLKETKKHYFMYVGMNAKIKNLDFIIDAFDDFRRKKEFNDYSLYLVGSSIDIKDKKNIINIPSVSREELKKLYAKAAGYLTASYYESFNFPVLEALTQGCSVVGLRSAIIPEIDTFVNTAETKTDFILQMEKVATGRGKIIDSEKIKQNFSWQQYINNLTSIYGQC